MASLLNSVRNVLDRAILNGNYLTHDVMPDERHDLSLIARRVYGRSSSRLLLVIMVAADLDSLEQPLSAQTLVLPALDDMARLIATAAQESQDDGDDF